MDWRHQTWQCPRCRFKLGCCEGATGEPSACGAEKISVSVTESTQVSLFRAQVRGSLDGRW